MNDSTAGTEATAVRASDAERDQAVALLQRHSDGRLTLAELEERSATAYTAPTLAQLRGLTARPAAEALAWIGGLLLVTIPIAVNRYRRATSPEPRRTKPTAGDCCPGPPTTRSMVLQNDQSALPPTSRESISRPRRTAATRAGC